MNGLLNTLSTAMMYWVSVCLLGLLKALRVESSCLVCALLMSLMRFLGDVQLLDAFITYRLLGLI
ncbi:hypothetical protein D3C80_1151090 [compost metagenome]